MKLYLMSQDPEDCVITDCNALKMFETYDTPIKLKGETERQVEKSLNLCLKECIRRQNRSNIMEKQGSPPQAK